MGCKLFLFLSLCCATLRSTAQVIDVRDFGLQPNTFTDATEKVKKALEACKDKPGATLYFPEGRYDFWPEKAAVRTYFITNTSSETECPSKDKTMGILLEGMKDLTIEGNRSIFMFHGKMVNLAMDRCKNIRLQNVEMDAERPGMSEMTLLTVSPEEVTAAVHPDSRFTILHNKLYWYGEGWTLQHFHAVVADTAKGIGKRTHWEPFGKAGAELISPFRIKFKGKFDLKEWHPGEIVSVRDPIRDRVGIFINRSAGISFANVRIRYMHGLGVVSQFSEDLSFDSLQVAPAPGSGRSMACGADGMQFSGCRGSISVTNSVFSGLHDDGINIHGTHLQVVEKVSPATLRIRFMHHQTYGFEAFFPGDSVALLNGPSLRIYRYGVLKAAKLLNEREMLVTFNEPLPANVKPGDCLENVTWTPSVVVRNNSFRQIATRGLLVTTARPVLVEQNTFYRMGMQAILIANDATSWYESGPVKDVTIRRNVFTECGYNSMPDNHVISISPENHKRVKGYKVHRNIRIEENTFRIMDDAVLSARSTDNLVMKHNTIMKTNFLPVPQQAKPAFLLTDCTNVEILDAGTIQKKKFSK
ncbi:right-handed parallel beta-helix repeat-containing protein [Chitinophaga niabensis]|uniref:Pectate lyase superfamily protein n=1 Tax=Chitinophaga niabensis TaxID=536979 RepID=A0A1N6FHS7_9BACT|nr:right-handed parallel beta-helix repeat-containing protein [Chitinophaga niabensis]SIN94804.1 Pectate lyase superfamily protein [Chitinophaga niabensis]